MWVFSCPEFEIWKKFEPCFEIFPWVGRFPGWTQVGIFSWINELTLEGFIFSIQPANTTQNLIQPNSSSEPVIKSLSWIYQILI